MNAEFTAEGHRPDAVPTAAAAAANAKSAPAESIEMKGLSSIKLKEIALMMIDYLFIFWFCRMAAEICLVERAVEGDVGQ